MRFKQKALSVLCAAALAGGLSLPALATAPAFSDVEEGAWYYSDMQSVVEKGLMSGTSKTTFSPQDYVTRATVLTTLWRLEGSPKASVSSLFPDISADHWGYTATAWAKDTGIATGYSDGNFGPNDTVTREQLAVFLYRYVQYKGQPIAEGVLDLYDDAAYISPWAVAGMKHALGAGLMRGTGTHLSPLGLATRAELAVILAWLTTPVKG